VARPWGVLGNHLTDSQRAAYAIEVKGGTRTMTNGNAVPDHIRNNLLYWAKSMPLLVGCNPEPRYIPNKTQLSPLVPSWTISRSLSEKDVSA
jgi:hypothetical protein